MKLLSLCRTAYSVWWQFLEAITTEDVERGRQQALSHEDMRGAFVRWHAVSTSCSEVPMCIITTHFRDIILFSPERHLC